MYYVMRASAPSLHRESTDSLIIVYAQCIYHNIIHTSYNNYKMSCIILWYIVLHNIIVKNFIYKTKAIMLK